MSAAWLKWLCFFGGVALASCAHLEQRQFAAAVDRFQSDAAFRAKAIGPQIWVTETTIWQDAEGFDRTISCTAIRPLEWFTQRGYRMIPTAEEASREGLTIGKKTYSAVTAAVTIGSSKSPPDAIYSFYRDEGEWNLSGVEIFSRQVAENGRPPAPRCVATEP